jgi:integrase/recombinase XerD
MMQNSGRFDQSLQITIADCIAEFIRSCRTNHCKVRTIKYYRVENEIFQRFCAKIFIYHISDVTPDILRQYILDVQTRRNEQGVHANYRAVRALLYWYEGEYEPDYWLNPIKKVRIPKPVSNPKPAIPINSLVMLLDVCDQSTFLGARNYAIILSMLDMGARPSEFISINLDDLNQTNGVVVLQKGNTKSGKERAVFVGQKTRKAIRKYLKMRTDNCKALWITEDKNRLTYEGLRGVLRKLSDMAAVKKPPLHSFRRTWALTMMRAKADPERIKKIGGWESWDVMSLYLDYNEDDLRDAFDQGSPVDKNL